jgi:hypothetical protein
MKMNSKAGRPTVYNEAIAEQILDLLASGQALHQLCQKPDFPTSRSVYRWLSQKPDFARKYSEARAAQADAVFDRGFEAAWNAEDAGLGRLKLDAAKWYCAKLAPRKYSDRLAIDQNPATDFVPLAEIQRRIQESKARRAAMEAGQSITIVENRVLG